MKKFVTPLVNPFTVYVVVVLVLTAIATTEAISNGVSALVAIFGGLAVAAYVVITMARDFRAPPAGDAPSDHMPPCLCGVGNEPGQQGEGGRRSVAACPRHGHCRGCNRRVSEYHRKGCPSEIHRPRSQAPVVVTFADVYQPPYYERLAPEPPPGGWASQVNKSWPPVSSRMANEWRALSRKKEAQAAQTVLSSVKRVIGRRLEAECLVLMSPETTAAARAHIEPLFEMGVLPPIDPDNRDVVIRAVLAGAMHHIYGDDVTVSIEEPS